MNSAFEEIRQRLYEEYNMCQKRFLKEDRDEDKYFFKIEAFRKAIEIVNEVAKEFGSDINVGGENCYISRLEVLRIIEDIKCNDDIPKNYGTLLDIMRQIRRLPSAPVNEPYVSKD